METSTQPLSFPVSGAHASKPDYRSSVIAAAVAKSVTPVTTQPPSLFTDFQKLGGSLNQLSTPACVSHAMAQLMKLWWYLKTGNIVNFSPRFLHAETKNIWTGPNDGRDPVGVAKIAQSIGCATIATCPNDTTLDNATYMNVPITPAMTAEAAQYKIPGFVSYPNPTQETIRMLITTYGAVSLLFRIGAEFWTGLNGVASWAEADIDPVRAPKNAADVVSGHELVGSGYNAALDHFVNSWSNGWAQQGEADYIFSEWAQYITEALVIAEVPSDALQAVRELPPPGEFKHNFATNIEVGQTGPEVRALQIALTIDGEGTYPEINGIYGPLTEQAVMAFQAKYQAADPDTIAVLAGKNVGPATRAALNKLFNI